MALGFVVAGPVIVVVTTMVSCVAPVPGSGAGKLVGAGFGAFGTSWPLSPEGVSPVPLIPVPLWLTAGSAAPSAGTGVELTGEASILVGGIVGAGLAGKIFFEGAFTTKRILPLLMDASTAVASQKTS